MSFAEIVRDLTSKGYALTERGWIRKGDALELPVGYFDEEGLEPLPENFADEFFGNADVEAS
jgi:hypothetical protein